MSRRRRAGAPCVDRCCGAIDGGQLERRRGRRDGSVLGSRRTRRRRCERASRCARRASGRRCCAAARGLGERLHGRPVGLRRPRRADPASPRARLRRGVDRVRERLLPLAGPVQRTAWRLRAQHARARARRDIAAHYDLGNELFALLLDETMMYSCARLRATGHDARARRQVAKLERICAQARRCRPDDHVLEIGTGWGGFARPRRRDRDGCRVTTTTISREQHALRASSGPRAPGWRTASRCCCEDYRDLRGSYDKLVSIEMIEAVGWRALRHVLPQLLELLAPDGAMLLQAIIDRRPRLRGREGLDAASSTRYIFPGGCLPSLEVIARYARARAPTCAPVDLEDITPHYARDAAPLARALPRRRDRAAHELGYDERFRRLWTLYLAYCEAGFAERRIRDVQLLLAKPAFRAEPLAPLHGCLRRPRASRGSLAPAE